MSKKDMIKQYVNKKISLLSHTELGSSKAELANLRHGVGKIPGEDPNLWGAFLEDAPEGLYGERINLSKPSREEWSVYLAITLFAVHIQGNIQVHQNGVSLGRAAAMLIESDTDKDRSRVLRRFAPIVTAGDMQKLSYHLRNFITLLKSKNIPLDYVKLSADLYDFQFDDSRKSVQLRWGRDFYETRKKDNMEIIGG